jgi:hypothetical protein
MRTQINPLAETVLPPSPEIVAAVITHLPDRKGYHAQRYEVIQASLTSLRHNAGRDLPIYVWDNGSDPYFRDWLEVEFRPRYLTLSPNIGKASARTAILRTFPPQTVICLSDDDICFEQNWLQPQLDLLQGFPNVGAVSGCPIRTQMRWGNKSTLAWAEKHATLKVGRFISDTWDRDFCDSIGRDYQHHLETSAQDQDYLIEYNGLQAYAAAHHMQFIGLAGRLEGIGLWTQKAMRVEQAFDVAMDYMGLLRLTTTERLTWHFGNVL